MKKYVCILLSSCLLSLPATLFGQSAATVVRVTVKAEKQIIRTGPYARFAQKYLGVIAPLSDKYFCTVAEAAITVGSAAAFAADHPGVWAGTPALPVSHTRNAVEFTKIPIDRQDALERSPEDAAREAAKTIFMLRKHRIELITGVAGENVFGAGLAAALSEIDRLEEEYLSLFMGKQSVQTIVRTYDIVPQAGELSRVVCRYSPEGGLLPADDLSGSPLVLQMAVTDKPLSAPVARTDKRDKNAPDPVYRLVPANVALRLVDGGREVAAIRAQITQMGRMEEVK